LFSSAIAEEHNKNGDSEYRQKEYVNAIECYSEGIKASCEDASLNALLLTNRATAHFQLGTD